MEKVLFSFSMMCASSQRCFALSRASPLSLALYLSPSDAPGGGCAIAETKRLETKARRGAAEGGKGTCGERSRWPLRSQEGGCEEKKKKTEPREGSSSSDIFFHFFFSPSPFLTTTTAHQLDIFFSTRNSTFFTPCKRARALPLSLSPSRLDNARRLVLSDRKGADACRRRWSHRRRCCCLCSLEQDRQRRCFHHHHPAPREVR